MTKPIYIQGEELSPRAMMMSLANLHGVGDELAEALRGKPEVLPPHQGLGHLLISARKASGQSIEEVHHRSRISRSQLSFYERGHHKNPGLRTIQALSYGYRIPFAMVLIAALWDIRPRARVRKRSRPK